MIEIAIRRIQFDGIRLIWGQLNQYYHGFESVSVLQISISILFKLDNCDQIYCASEAFGHGDIRTSGGYFQLAKVFNELNENVIADSLFDKVSIHKLSFIFIILVWSLLEVVYSAVCFHSSAIVPLFQTFYIRTTS